MNLTRVLKVGVNGDDVKALQSQLRALGYYKGDITGNFGTVTQASVILFQKAKNINADGAIGNVTWSMLFSTPVAKVTTTTTTTTTTVATKPKSQLGTPNFVTSNGLEIFDFILPDDEYYKEETEKKTIVVHHTAGAHNPINSRSGWDSDTQGKVATAYIMGGASTSTDDTTYDGKVIRTFDDKYWAHHLGIKSKENLKLNKQSVGLEICNYGPIAMKNGIYLNYVNREMPEKDVIKLDAPFRGYTYYHRYTEAQLVNTKKWILYIAEKYSIQIERGIYNREWFEYNAKYLTNPPALGTHTQFRADKFDLSPQPDVIEMLNSL